MNTTYRPQSRSSNHNPGGRILLWLVAVAAFCGIAYFIYNRFFAAPPAPPAPPPPAVSVLEIRPQDMPVTYEYAGRTAGSLEVEVRPRVGGILEKRLYEEGSWVKKGQKLFRINSQNYQATQSQAKARFAQAKSDWTRAKALLAEKAISPREYDTARFAYEQLKAEVESADINVGYTTVIAPVSGVTSKESLSEGSLLKADDSLLTRITRLNPLYVEFAYPDSDAVEQRKMLASGKLALPEDRKLTAEMRFGDGNVYEKQGNVNFTDSFVDTETGTVQARATFANPELSIMPGQFVKLVVKGFTRTNAIVIPDRAVLQGPQGTFVYLIGKENKASVRPVTLGPVEDNQRIIEKGLETGDKVIVEGMIKVKPDMPVKIDTAPAKDAALTEKNTGKNG